jgi:hypothetical protein
MITISEVLEEAARVCADRGTKFHSYSPYSVECHNLAEAIRALAAKYENCIVAEGASVGVAEQKSLDAMLEETARFSIVYAPHATAPFFDRVPLYRAKGPTK